MENIEPSYLVDPDEEIVEILGLLSKWYLLWGFGPASQFADEIKAFECDSNEADFFRRDLLRFERSIKDSQKFPYEQDTLLVYQLMLIYVSVSYCAEARLQLSGSGRQWRSISKAREYLGMIGGTVFGNAIGSDIAISLKARRNGSKAHKENRAMKQQVFDWCTTNLATFRSMDRAAFSVAGTLVPVEVRTVRKWIGEWKKKTAAP